MEKTDKKQGGTPPSNTGVPKSKQNGHRASCEAVLDWFSVVLKKHTLNDVLNYFGNDYVKLDYARYRYDYTLVFHEKIFVYVSSREDMNIFIVLSGRACRLLEEYYDWYSFFQFIKLYQNHGKFEYISNFNISRLDYSFDFYNWKFDILTKVEKHYKKNMYTSIFRKVTHIEMKNTHGDILGRSFRFGKRDSDLSILFYDKLLERNNNDHIIDNSISSWYRIENSFCNDNAMLLFDMISRDFSAGKYWVCKIMLKYIDFKTDSINKSNFNRSRAFTSRWWTDCLNTTQKLTLSKKAYQSTIDKKIHHVEHSTIKSLSMIMVAQKLVDGSVTSISLLDDLMKKSSKKIKDMDLMIVNEYLQKNGKDKISLEQLQTLINDLI